MVTSHSDFHLENKRLCNVSQVREQSDADNLNLLQRVVRQEIRTVYNVTSSMRADIDENNAIIQIIESNINEKLQRLQTDTESTRELMFINSVLVYQLDHRMNEFKNECR